MLICMSKDDNQEIEGIERDIDKYQITIVEVCRALECRKCKLKGSSKKDPLFS